MESRPKICEVGTLMIALHYYTSGREYSEDNPDHWLAVQPQISWLLQNGLLMPVEEDAGEVASSYTASYRTTEKCAAWIGAMVRLPLPVQRWVIATDETAT